MNSMFRRVPFGYSPIEVEAFISELQKAIEAEKNEIDTLKEQMELQAEELKKYHDQERFISGAILNAQNNAVEIERKAQEKYDQTILRLNEESDLWENRIKKNKERLIALDDMIKDFLASIKSEMELALTPTRERIAIGSADIDIKAADIPLDAEAVPFVADAPLENPPEPVLSGDVQNFYWKLKKIEYGVPSTEDDAIPCVMTAANTAMPVRSAAGRSSSKPVEAPVIEPASSDNEQPNSGDGVYIPNEAERSKLSELCRELGIL